jgi:hypothetical protein
MATTCIYRAMNAAAQEFDDRCLRHTAGMSAGPLSGLTICSYACATSHAPSMNLGFCIRQISQRRQMWIF